MPSTKRTDITAFGGLNTTLQPHLIGNTDASDLYNVRRTDSGVITRYGWRTIGSIPASWSACNGFNYVQGYDSSRAEVERFLAVETVSSNNYPYEVNVSTGARTQIKKSGAVSQTFEAGDWQMFSIADSAFWVNGSASTTKVFKHTLGSANSLLAVSPPAAPTAPTVAITYGDSAHPYTEIDWYVANPTITKTLWNTATRQSDGSILATMSAGISGSTTLTIDLGVGNLQDWTYNDCFAIPVSYPNSALFQIDITKTTITFINNDGSPITLSPDATTCTVGAPLRGSNTFWIRADFLKKTRTDWDNVRKIVINISVTANTSGSVTNVYFDKLVVGGVPIYGMPSPADPSKSTVRVACSYKSSTLGLYSSLSPVVDIPIAQARGLNVGSIGYLGSRFTLTVPASADATVVSAEAWIYWLYNQGQRGWLLMDEQSVTINVATTTNLRKNSQDLITPTTHAASNLFTNTLAAIPFKTWVVWLEKGGTANVRHSWVYSTDINNVLRLHADTDPLDDPLRGADFSLADNFGDEPLGGVEAGDALILLGNNGVYAQLANTGLFMDEKGPQNIGFTPTTMTPCMRMPGLHGCAGRFAYARFRHPAGMVGCAYVDRDGNVWFVSASRSSDGVDFNKLELSKDIRGYLRSWLMSGYSDLSSVRMGVDEYDESLWLVLGKRALVMRKPTAIDADPKWEPYEYNLGGAYTISYLAFSNRQWCKAMLSTGQIVEFERNRSTGSAITGTSRDGGNVAPTAYWASKRFIGENRRLMRIECHRGTLTDTPAITVYCDRQSAGVSKTWTSGKIQERWNYDVQGWYFYFKVAIGENAAAMSRLTAEFLPAGDRPGR